MDSLEASLILKVNRLWAQDTEVLIVNELMKVIADSSWTIIYERIADSSWVIAIIKAVGLFRWWLDHKIRSNVHASNLVAVGPLNRKKTFNNSQAISIVVGLSNRRRIKIGKMEEEKQELKKLFIFNGKYFNNWKFRIETLLREHDAEDCIIKSLEEFDEIAINNLDDQATRDGQAKLKEELRKKERKCFSLIVQRIGNDYLESIKDKINPKQAWSSLCNTFERKDVSNRMFLRWQLLSMKINEKKLEIHLLKFDKIQRQLKSVGAKMEEGDVICQLLISQSLPMTYDT